MKTENAIRLLAGSMVLLSLILSHLVSPWWQLLAVFVGANLVQSVFTGICPGAMILEKLGITSGCCGAGSCCEEKKDGSSEQSCCGGH